MYLSLKYNWSCNYLPRIHGTVYIVRVNWIRSQSLLKELLSEDSILNFLTVSNILVSHFFFLQEPTYGFRIEGLFLTVRKFFGFPVVTLPSHPSLPPETSFKPLYPFQEQWVSEYGGTISKTRNRVPVHFCLWNLIPHCTSLDTRYLSGTYVPPLTNPSRSWVHPRVCRLGIPRSLLPRTRFHHCHSFPYHPSNFPLPVIFGVSNH